MAISATVVSVITFLCSSGGLEVLDGEVLDGEGGTVGFLLPIFVFVLQALYTPGPQVLGLKGDLGERKKQRRKQNMTMFICTSAYA